MKTTQTRHAAAVVVCLVTVGLCTSLSSEGQTTIPAEENLLAVAAQAIAQRISKPIEPSSEQDREWRQFERDLALTVNWPHPLFRQPLLAILEGNEPSRAYKAAKALSAYPDNETQRLVADIVRRRWLEKDAEVWRRFTEVPLATKKLTPFLSQPDVFPVSPEGGVLIPDYYSRRMTVPAAVGALQHGDLSVRLQALVWLAQVGLIVDLAPLEAAWPQLSGCAQATVLNEMTGRPRMGAALRREWVVRHLANWNDYDESVQSALMMWGVDVDCHELTPIAKRILDAYETETADKAEAARRESTRACNRITLADAALYALLELENLNGDALKSAMRWACSNSRTLRNGGCCILARSDDWRATYIAFGFFAANEPSVWPVDMMHQLVDREWNDRAVQGFWLRGLLRLLQTELKQYDDVERIVARPGGRYKALETIDLMRAIAGTTVVDIDRDGNVVAVAELRRVVTLWDRWIARNFEQE